MKVVFLDIDGVLQPRTHKRHEHRNEIPAFCRMMDKRLNGLYHYVGWLGESGFDPMDVGAVRYDWDVTAVETLKRVLDKSKAKIVLSSDWKDMRAMRLMKALLAIHDLDRHPEVVSYVAVDDMNLIPGLEGHFVKTWPALTVGDGRKMLKCLAVEDGPYRLPPGCRTNGLKRIRRDYLPIIDRLWRREPTLHSPDE